MELELSDIQGNLVRGYRVKVARHFPLTVTDPAAARQFVASLVTPNSGAPQISTAAERNERPYHLTIGFTWSGLGALGVAADVLARFPAAFREGSAARASLVGDVGESDPVHWSLGKPSADAVHILLSLYAREKAELNEKTAQLNTLFSRHRLSSGAPVISAEALNNEEVHFGYRDGLSQPHVRGLTYRRSRPPSQPECEPGEFLLGKGYSNLLGRNHIGQIPAVLGDNGTYAAVRVLEQDTWGFERFLVEAAARHGLDRELLAAKLMGRWRNGTPLSLSPDRPDPATPIPPHEINNFDFLPTPASPHIPDDSFGLRCPIGAHIRRMNPRSHPVAGLANTRRIIRRGMAYGPRFDRENFTLDTPRDNEKRGLVGFFICGDLEWQFEFIMKAWANQDRATAGIRGTLDPLIGAHEDGGGQFILPTASSRLVVNGLQRFVRTCGSLYCFVPGLSGLRWLTHIEA